MSERILVVAHNHPEFHPGGTEIFAHDLFRAYGRVPGVATLFLAATNEAHRQPRPGTVFQAVGRGENEVVMWGGHFDPFFLSQVDTYGTVPDLQRLLEEFRPDVVHLHHVLLLGAEIVPLIRRVLPECRIVLTVHDYFVICAHHGLMVKKGTGELCHRATPDGCRGCFPEVAADRFVLRQRYLQTLLSAVDLFITPSQFAAERLVEWGVPSNRLEVVANGRPAAPTAPHRSSADGRRPVFGYFGNQSPWKGVPVLLRAAKILAERGFDFELRLHGGMPFQTPAFVEEMRGLIQAGSPHVVTVGTYRHEEIPALMAAVDWTVVPSVWWENAPLVIQEAFHHARPVIASGIGGMAEMVEDGVSGLHVPHGDPGALAAAMMRAADDGELWQRLVAGIRKPPSIDSVAARHLALFRRLERLPRAA
jgi:glycosyltransferase involved in cell wall biosynthesis